jgi:outer membrane protein TolC
LASADRAFVDSRALFEAGRMTSLELLDAETELTRVRAELVAALADSRIAWAGLLRAQGRRSP